MKAGRTRLVSGIGAGRENDSPPLDIRDSLTIIGQVAA
jgi:hypothetical protein